MGTVRVTDLGRQPYRPVWELQRELAARRKAGGGVDRLLVVEHEPVITLGRRAQPEHVLVDGERLAERGIELVAVERGGDVTYHGPGQLVAYPILDLTNHRKDVRWYSGALLQALVATLAVFGLPAEARSGAETGVWLRPPAPAGKVAALGVRIERWVSYHGVALNVQPDPAHFELIVPCGLAGPGHGVVSMVEALGQPVALSAVRDAFVAAFAEVFGVVPVAAPLPHDLAWHAASGVGTGDGHGSPLATRTAVEMEDEEEGDGEGKGKGKGKGQKEGERK